MDHLTFPNKMTIIYYALDSILGIFEAHFLFKLMRERYLVVMIHIIVKIEDN